MHKITINGREMTEELSKFYRLSKPMYETGETVTFSFPTATDTSYKVTSAQVRINIEGYAAGGISTYSFIMPDTDVDIEISSRSSMMNPYMNGLPLPGMGMMNMEMINRGMMGMNSPVNSSSVSHPDLYPWEGKPKFCPECGAPTGNSNKFCGECGAPFLSKE